MPDYTIIANGPFLPEAIIKAAIANHTIIALDGAANHLQSLNIVPDIILGDFDSIHPENQTYWGIQHTFAQLHVDDKPYIGNHSVRIVPALNQNFTDLEKAIQYCDQHAASQISILCATGGREDLHEGTKIAIRNAYRSNRPILVHTASQTLRYLRDESVQFYGQPGDHCGFIAMNGGTCSIEGLTYEGQNLTYSVSNRLKTHSASIHAQGEALIIMPLQLGY